METNNNQNGQGEDYLKNLYETLGKNGSTSVDKKLLEERFYKLIDEKTMIE